MSVVGGIIAGVAAKVGAGMVRSAIEERFGSKAGNAAGNLAGTVIGEVAGQLGVEPSAIPDIHETEPERLESAVLATEAQMPELIELWSKGLEGQFALLQAEMKEGFWQSFWRWGWMYLLAFFWIWRIVILPVVNWRITTADNALPIEAIEFGVLLTLTGWFISLYMGGHTLKELGRNVADAVGRWKGGAR